MKYHENTKKQSGITLIALVVTIVVLLILAAVSIGMLTGENGIINQAKKAKDDNEQARLEELVDLAVGSLITQKNGDISSITPQMVADEINKTENRSDVYPEGDTFPTNIIFPEEGRKVETNLEESTSYDGIYNEGGLEGKIAPTDLFEFEIIDNTSSGTTEDGLPTKTARIKKIKPQYCNGGGYNPITGKNDLTDTNYEIVYNGEKILDTLVIPYQVEIDGEMYRITEANMFIISSWDEGRLKNKCMSLPRVRTIIYPNTIEKIYNSSEFGVCDENITLKKVILSNNLKEIGDYAFFGCVDLVNINLPNSITKIGHCAFSFCSSLKSITIPEGITNIGLGYATFLGCASLNNITIPEGITNIGFATFAGCASLNNITIPEGVTSIEDNTFDGCSSLTSIDMPSSVTNIGERAFYNCSSLIDIKISSNVTNIGKSAFVYCNSLTNIQIPSSVSNIENDAFHGCSSLTNINVETGNTNYDSRDNCNAIIEKSTNKLIQGCGSTTIPNTVTSIGSSAFAYCDSLTGIIIPNSVTSIEDNAFYNCSSLNNIEISNNVTNIGSYTFAYCDALTEITIPNGVTNIEDNVFYNCSSLTDVIIPNSVTSIGSSAFSSCEGLTKITIPNSVTSIGSSAFSSCESLTEITIPDSITSIERSVFSNCSSLTNITIPNSVINIENSAFAYCDNLKTVNYTGTKAQWNQISIGNLNNTGIWNAQIICTDGTIR